MSSRGFQQSMAIGFETTFGVAATSQDIVVPGLCNLKRKNEPLDEERPYADVDAVFYGEGTIEVAGRIELSLYTGMMGNESFRQWFYERLADGDLKSATVWKQLKQYTVRYTGVKVASWDLAFVSKEEVVLSLDCRGKDGGKVDAVSLDFSTLGTKYTFVGTSVKIGGVTDTRFVRVRYRGENNLEDDGYRLAASASVAVLDPGGRDVKVEFERDIFDSGIWDSFVAKAPLNLVTTATAGASTLTVTTPKVVLTDPDAEMANRKGRSRTDGEGTAYAQADGTDSITIAES